ncbi:MAG TPA: DUF1294 domain-containing protein [Candidatus Limivicinus faecipullorum]|nr:DUF1294 domain-containing protein [Candidatus Limivicinus faecipullorum]
MKYAALYLMWLCFMSLICMLAMGLDKLKARQGARRIPEYRLFLLALLGGGPGGWLGMYAFRHKTKHMKFVIGFPIIAAVQVLAALYLLKTGG